MIIKCYSNPKKSYFINQKFNLILEFYELLIFQNIMLKFFREIKFELIKFILFEKYKYFDNNRSFKIKFIVEIYDQI